MWLDVAAADCGRELLVLSLISHLSCGALSPTPSVALFFLRSRFRSPLSPSFLNHHIRVLALPFRSLCSKARRPEIGVAAMYEGAIDT